MSAALGAANADEANAARCWALIAADGGRLCPPAGGVGGRRWRASVANYCGSRCVRKINIQNTGRRRGAL